MHNINDRCVQDVKGMVKSLKNFLGVLMLAFIAVGILYFCIWLAAISNDSFLEGSAPAINFIPNLFFPGETDYIMYRNTAGYLLAAIIVINVLFFVIDFFEDMFVKTYYKIHDVSGTIADNKQQRQIGKKYDEIDTYSICISADYDEATKKISESSKYKLNEVIYNSIVEKIVNFPQVVKYSQGNTFVFVNTNFVRYDELYNDILRALSGIKKKLMLKLKVNIIITITTDAHVRKYSFDDIIYQHKEIKKCNFLNRATTTADFLKKYKFMGFERFGGTPIGLYNSENGLHSYNLNIVYKNLSKTFQADN